MLVRNSRGPAPRWSVFFFLLIFKEIEISLILRALKIFLPGIYFPSKNIFWAFKIKEISISLKIKRKKKTDQRGAGPLELRTNIKLNDGGDTAVI